MPRGRPKGSVNKKKGNGADAIPTTDHRDNVAKAPLTDEQREALTNSWVREYEKSLALKKAADADLKNICKKAKADGVTLAEIKAYIDAGTEEGQEKLQEDAERLARVARWRNFDIGHQFRMELDAPAPVANRSRVLGKEAGLAGEKATPPKNCDVNEWMAGWQDGQAALAGGIKKLPEDDEDIRPEFLKKGGLTVEDAEFN